MSTAPLQIRLQPGLSSRERQLLQEARMAALGECYQLVEAVNGLPFDAWYSSEIISVLTAAQLRLQQVCSHASTPWPLTVCALPACCLADPLLLCSTPTGAMHVNRPLLA